VPQSFLQCNRGVIHYSIRPFVITADDLSCNRHVNYIVQFCNKWLNLLKQQGFPFDNLNKTDAIIVSGANNPGLSPSRGRSIGPSTRSCRPKTGRESKARVNDEYCVTCFGPSPAAVLCYSGGVVSSASGTALRSPIEKPRETDDRR
jgi:hypothetical protein